MQQHSANNADITVSCVPMDERYVYGKVKCINFRNNKLLELTNVNYFVAVHMIMG